VLRIVRESPYRVSLKTILESLNYSKLDVINAVKSLLEKSYLRQNIKDGVPWNNYNATFFTEPYRRKIIDRILKRVNK